MSGNAWVELGGFLFGLLFGSFLNVCISRLPQHQSIVTPRSRCESCGHAIRWYDNLPVLSWILLRARCRDCSSPISWRYPAVEIATGVWFAIAALKLHQLNAFVRTVDFGAPAEVYWGDNLPLIAAFAIIGFLLIGLLVMDWQTHRLPDAFTLSGIAIGFALTCVQAWFLEPGEGDIAFNTSRQLRLSGPGSFQARGNVFLTGTEAMVLGRVAAIAGAALLLLTIRWAYKAARGHEGMGLGDVKLLAMIAAFLGLFGSLLAFFAGVMAALLYALFLLARRRATAQTRLPFGTFLAAGGLFAALWGHRIADWYVGFWR